MWRDAKMVGDAGDNTLLAHMCKAFMFPFARSKCISSESGPIIGSENGRGASSGSDAHDRVGRL